jgi:hypothetical protein
MMKFIDNTVTFLVALIGLIGGGIWAFSTNFDFEPMILLTVSTITIIGFVISKLFFSTNNKLENSNLESIKQTNNSSNSQSVEVNLNVGNLLENKDSKIGNSPVDRNAIIDNQKSRIHILFIDDDTKFKTVQMFKDSGWKNTKTVKDIKSIDLPVVKNADIIFVDINGVGKLLYLEYEGLDLAYMIKEKYPDKKVVIYSAKKDSNSFHKAWDIIDARIEKNALPIQFQNVVDNYCLSKKENK